MTWLRNSVGATFVLLQSFLLSVVFAADVSNFSYDLNRLDHLRFKSLDDNLFQEIGITGSIVEDDQGFMWVVGDTGAARYDGSQVKMFKNEPGNPDSIPSRLIAGMEKDLSGRLWLYGQDGLYLYHADTEQFKHIALDIGSGIHPAVLCMAVQKNGHLLLGFGGYGFAEYDPTTSKLVHYNEVNNGAYSGDVRAIIEDAQGDVWLGSPGGLSRYSFATKQYTRYKLKGVGSQVVDDILELYLDKDGIVWIGTAAGIFRRDESNNQFLGYEQNKNDFSSGRIIKIEEDRDGLLWISRLGGGVAVYDEKKNTFKQIKRRVGDPSSINNDVLLMHAFNRANELWLGYYPSGGVVIDPHASALQTFVHEPANQNSLSHSAINSLAVGYNNDLWVATDGGINHLNLETGSATRFQNDANNPQSLSSNGTHSILLDSQARVWVGTWLGGLNQYNTKTQKFTRYRHDPNDSHSINDDVVWAVAEKDSQSIWVGTRKGLSILDIASGEFKPLTYSAEEVRGIHNLGENRLLVQHLNSVQILDTNTLTALHISVPGWGNLAPVSDTFVNKNGEVWFATTKGLKYWPTLTSPVNDFADAGEKMLSSYFQVVEKNGEVWLGSTLGITSFDTKTKAITEYSVDHGLPGNAFTHANTTVLLPDGRIAMGSTKGLVIFNPDDTYKEKAAAQTILTGLSVLDKEVNSAVVGGPIDRSISLAKQITLNHDQRVFSIKYTALDFQLSQKTQFEYQLQGFDDDWRQAGFSRSATYTNLNPGRYTFVVKAINDRGLWSQKNASIDVVILPPWWQTWWAYTLYTLFVVFIISLVIYVVWSKQQRQREHKVNERLKEIDELKDEFLANTSHELRTPLHGIISLSEIILSDSNRVLTDNKVENLQLIHSSAKRLSALINDILDFSKLKQASINLSLEALDLRSLLNEVIGLISPLIKDKPLRLDNQIPKNIPRVKADLNRTQQIFHNLIGNAIKFTERGCITVSAEVVGEKVVISIKDTGIGIPESRMNSIFTQFEQVDGSIERKYGGTGLGLSVSKQLVELHGGTIGVNSVLGEGTEFYFDFPIYVSDEPDWIDPQEDSITHSNDTDLNDNQETTAASAKLSNENQVIAAFSTAVEKNATGSMPHILIVDDEMVNRRVLETYLGAQSYVYTSCKNGTEVLELLAHENTFESISLILLDVMMPDISGLEVCKKIREKYKPNQLPIIFLTAKSGERDIELGYEAGGNDYLKKPFSKIELFLRMELHMELRNVHDHLEETVRKRTEALEISNLSLKDTNEKLVDLQGMLVQSEKMSSLGILVSGIGHEINNPVNFINAAAFNLRNDLSVFHEYLLELAGDEAEEVVEDFATKFNELNAILVSIDDGVSRVNDVVDNLRTFSRSGGKILEPRKLGSGIQSTIKLVQAKYKAHIDFKIDLAFDPIVNAIPSEINQVIMNLMVNACYALLKRKESETSEGDWKPLLEVITKEAEEYLIIQVSDNGTGMTDEVKSKIFDPFYTTKPEGEGTGLGMSISHGIVRRHKGRLNIESTLGHGSTFTLLIPLISI